MPHHISYENHIVKVVFDGRVSTEELLELDKEIFANYEASDCIGHLYDYRNVEGVSFSETDMKRISLLDKNESFVIGPLKIAIIVTDEKIAQYSRLYVDGLTGSEWQAALFDTEASALGFITNS